MKIGVITYYSSDDNYGQLLQCYALQRFLKKNGHETFLIKYKEEQKLVKEKHFNILFKIKRYLSHPFVYSRLFFLQRKQARYLQTAQNQLRQFDKFRNVNICSTEKVYRENELLANPPEADAYICGSDQIWGGSFPYYLNFAPKTSKKIAYAASFGGVNSFSEEYEKELKRLLTRFHMLGVREDSGVHTCHRLGFKHAIKVVDPTLLLSSNDYNEICCKQQLNDDFIFVYLLGNPCDLKMEEVYSLANKKSLKVVYVASQGQYDKYPKTWATIGEWINYLAKAKMVITNSFHCTVFSLIYHKNFVSVPLSGEYTRMNSRISELLSLCGLSDHLYEQHIHIDDYFNKIVSFEGFDKYLSIEVQNSKNILLDSLEND